MKSLLCFKISGFVLLQLIPFPSIDFDYTYTSLFLAARAAANMPKDIEIVCGRYIGDDQPCFIIAEIGQNHQGDIEIAKQLIKTAKVYVVM